jgi:hypothetical protein
VKFNKILATAFLITLSISPLSTKAALINDYATVTRANGVYDGGIGVNSAYSEADAQNKAFISFTNADYLPTIKVKAASSSTAYVSALAVQRYTFTGIHATDLFLNFNLHASINAQNRYSPLRADIGIILGEEVEFFPEYGFATNFFEGGALMGEELGYESLFLGNGLDKNKSSFLSFTINPGESFFVYASVEANVKNGFVDAWNTFSMDFTDNTGLRAASAPLQVSVPEPSTLVLMFLAMAFIVRKKIKS